MADIENIEFPEASSDESFLEELERPPAFQFYASNWISSTSLMDAEQRGWYIQLLAWAWGNSPIQGALVDDEDELRLIAGNKSLSTTSKIKHMLENAGADLAEEVAFREAEKRWKKVREKFVPDPEHPGFVHNPRLTKVLKRQEMYRDVRKNRAKLGAEAKWQRYREENPDKVKTANNPTTTTSIPKHTPSKAPVELKHNQAHAKPLLESASLSLPLISTSLSSFSNGNKSSSKPKRVETDFDPSKFVIKNYMRDWFNTKYPGHTEEDYQYIGERFSDARQTYGARAKDWWASFRTYVNGFMTEPNEIVKLPSKRRKSESGVNNNGRFESTLAERERLSREEDEHLQRLRSGSDGNSVEGSKSLQLPPFATNTKR